MKKQMLKKGFALMVIFFFIGLVIIPTCTGIKMYKTILPSLSDNILYVGGSGGDNYTTIQSAINDANSGDTIFVYDDSSPYYENVVIDRSISLVGENNQTTVIDANYVGSPIEILADDCIVSGFTIQHSENPGSTLDYSVIKIIDCQHIIIKNNILTLGEDDYDTGTASVHVIGHYCTIQNNYMFQGEDNWRTAGVNLDEGSTYNIVTGNEITGFQYGVRIFHSDYNTLSNNNIHHCTNGIEVWACEHNEIINNKIEYHILLGIDFEASPDNTISNNIISNNGNGDFLSGGIMLWQASSTNNYFSNNEISYNSPTGIFMNGALNNVITMNNFIDNGEGGSSERYVGHVFFKYYLADLFDGYNPFRGNTWKENYWSDSLWFNIKLIPGEMVFIQGWPWYNFDWRPAKQPYDI